MKHLPLVLLCLIFILFWFLDSSGASLVPLMLLTSAASGSVAVAAAARLSNAKWIAPVEQPLLTLAPLLILPAVYVHRMGPYGWAKHPNAWLNPAFFQARGSVLFALLLIAAMMFRRAAPTDSAKQRWWAVMYIFLFVAALSLMAFDWVMSFDHPWISTMFGPLFMVEAFYTGLALAGILCCVLRRKDPGAMKNPLHSTATLMFGFSIFWGGLFFAQYLTIWYGNLPEEVEYLSRRFDMPGGGPLFWGSLIFLFFIPLLTLLTNPPRRTPAAVAAASCSIFIGILLERLFYLLPHVRFNPVWLPLEMLAVIGIVALAARRGMRMKDEG